MIYRIFAMLALVTLVIGAALLTGPQRSTATPPVVEEASHESGYSAHEAKLVQTGADGLPLYTLNAEVIRQEPDHGNVELQQVQLGFRDASGNEWTGRADRGEVGPNTETVQLSGNVHVAGMLPGTTEDAEISTDRLSFDTQDQVLSTEDPVALFWSGHQLDARGLLANLKGRRVQLESAVHGTFSR